MSTFSLILAQVATTTVTTAASDAKNVSEEYGFDWGTWVPIGISALALGWSIFNTITGNLRAAEAEARAKAADERAKERDRPQLLVTPQLDDIEEAVLIEVKITNNGFRPVPVTDVLLVPRADDVHDGQARPKWSGITSVSLYPSRDSDRYPLTLQMGTSITAKFEILKPEAGEEPRWVDNVVWDAVIVEDGFGGKHRADFDRWDQAR